jgi:hypothetical protein
MKKFAQLLVAGVGIGAGLQIAPSYAATEIFTYHIELTADKLNDAYSDVYPDIVRTFFNFDYERFDPTLGTLVSADFMDTTTLTMSTSWDATNATQATAWHSLFSWGDTYGAVSSDGFSNDGFPLLPIGSTGSQTLQTGTIDIGTVGSFVAPIQTDTEDRLVTDPVELGDYWNGVIGNKPDTQLIGPEDGGARGYVTLLYKIFCPIPDVSPPGTVCPDVQVNDKLDIDYTITYSYIPSVPEPATWSMLLVGFCSIGWMMRNSRQPGVPA